MDGVLGAGATDPALGPLSQSPVWSMDSHDAPGGLEAEGAFQGAFPADANPLRGLRQGSRGTGAGQRHSCDADADGAGLIPLADVLYGLMGGVGDDVETFAPPVPAPPAAGGLKVENAFAHPALCLCPLPAGAGAGTWQPRLKTDSPPPATISFVALPTPPPPPDSVDGSKTPTRRPQRQGQGAAKNSTGRSAAKSKAKAQGRRASSKSHAEAVHADPGASGDLKPLRHAGPGGLWLPWVLELRTAERNAVIRRYGTEQQRTTRPRNRNMGWFKLAVDVSSASPHVHPMGPSARPVKRANL